MKFKYSAIGDNTSENRKHLEKLGYKIFHAPIGIANGTLSEYNTIRTVGYKGS